MSTYRVRCREDNWFVVQLEAETKEGARCIVENEIRRFEVNEFTEYLKPRIIDMGCDFCGIEKIEKLGESTDLEGFQVVPDEYGGHLISPEGEKWYPASAIKRMK